VPERNDTGGRVLMPLEQGINQSEKRGARGPVKNRGPNENTFGGRTPNPRKKTT